MTEKAYTFHIDEFNEVFITREKDGKVFCIGDEDYISTEAIDGIVEELNELYEENIRLKSQIGCDDVCHICKHESLIKKDKYYVAKCDKGHEECSKMDLRYCEDFEAKEVD